MKKFLPFFLLFFAFIACKKDPKPTLPKPYLNLDLVSTDISYQTTDVAPLSPKITFKTSEPVYVSATVLGKNGSESNISHTFDNEVGTEHSLGILGLYPDYENTIALFLHNEEGAIVDLDTVVIQTKSELPSNLPGIEVETAQKNKMADGLTLISNYGMGMHVPFMIDHFGDIRWYLDYSDDPEMSKLFYDCGVERLKNGNLYFGNGDNRTIYEVDMHGETVNSWHLGEYAFHHNVKEKPNGNFLVTVSKDGSTHQNGSATIEDYVIEINRSGGGVVMEWDLKQSLDEYRTTMKDDLAENPVDWFHGNAVIYDERDHSIIVSGRTQGLVKLDYSNNVKWILGPHKEWGTAGNGKDLNQYLLAPLDAAGNEIMDADVRNGNTSHPDFEWNWYQHAPSILPDGSLLLFDNGDNREWGNAPAYSRAVQYDIDEGNMTVKQLWSYGKNRSHDTYSFIVSDADYLPEAGNVLFSPGCMTFNTPSGKNEGRVVEVDRATKQVVFEARFIAPPGAYVVLHRAERLSLYPEQ